MFGRSSKNEPAKLAVFPAVSKQPVLVVDPNLDNNATTSP